jgi:hypothetical protein
MLLLLPAASEIEFMDALSSTDHSLLPTLFTLSSPTRLQIAKWVARVIPLDTTSPVNKSTYDFILTLSGLSVTKTGLGFSNLKDSHGVSFLKDLHSAYFEAGLSSSDSFSVESWLSACKFIDSIIFPQSVSVSDSLLEALSDLRNQVCQHVLSQISGPSRFCLLESMADALLTFADELSRPTAQSWFCNQALMSYFELLHPWVSCIRGLSFNHSAVMKSIMKRIGLWIDIIIVCTRSRIFTGPSFTKGQALSSFFKTVSRVDVLLAQIYPPDQKQNVQDKLQPEAPDFSVLTRIHATNVLNAVRMSFQRFTIAVRAHVLIPFCNI